jgi:ATP-dependent helicase/nuclease subunit A
VIDFKTDRPAPPRAEDAPEGYVLQMALYQAVLSQIFPGKPVRCALIWTDGPHLVDLPAAQLERTLKSFAEN